MLFKYIILASFFTLAACSKWSNNEKFSPLEHGLNTPIAQSNNKIINPHTPMFLVIDTISGSIEIKLLFDKAPVTVRHLIDLITVNSLKKIMVKRAIPSYIVQLGPQSTRVHKSQISFHQEFNNLQHIRGAVSFAINSGTLNGRDDEFYIALSTLPHLNGKFTVFGQVVSGLDILEQLHEGDPITQISITNFSPTPKSSTDIGNGSTNETAKSDFNGKGTQE